MSLLPPATGPRHRPLLHTWVRERGADEKGAPIEDLRKAQWYLSREIARREEAEPKKASGDAIR